MTTFQTIQIKCPHCQEEMYTYELTSYITTHSEVYSDGKNDHNKQNLLQELALCAYCSKPLWKEDVIIHTDDAIDFNQAKEVMYLTDLFPSFETDHENKTIDYLLNLLQTNFANTVDREVYLRIELWHLFNNSRRSISTGISRRIKRLFTRLFRINHTTNFQHYSIHFKPNLEQLISIFHPNNDSEKLYKAEMHRQLAQFSEAELLLRDIVSIENKGLLKAIKKANKHKEHEVFRL